MSGQAYTTAVTAYDKVYRPVRTTTVIPVSEGAPAGTYQSGTAYELSGKVAALSCSAARIAAAFGPTGGGRKTQVTNTYEHGTQRLATTSVDREDQPGVDQHATKFKGHEPVDRPTRLRGFSRTLGLAGGLAMAAEAASYVKEYGWGAGAVELSKDIVDPFGFHEASEPPRTSGGACPPESCA